VTASTRRVDRETRTTVTIRNVSTDRTPVVGARADVFADGRQVLPICWSDNQDTLWPGEQQTITASYDADGLGGTPPTVGLSGFNVATRRRPAPRSR
jgi:exo-1,4-beta-D-glucosaminidase